MDNLTRKLNTWNKLQIISKVNEEVMLIPLITQNLLPGKFIMQTLFQIFCLEFFYEQEA